MQAARLGVRREAKRHAAMMICGACGICAKRWPERPGSSSNLMAYLGWPRYPSCFTCHTSQILRPTCIMECRAEGNATWPGHPAGSFLDLSTLARSLQKRGDKAHLADRCGTRNPPPAGRNPSRPILVRQAPSSALRNPGCLSLTRLTRRRDPPCVAPLDSGRVQKLLRFEWSAAASCRGRRPGSIPRGTDCR